MPNIGGLTNFTGLQFQFVSQRRSLTVNLALKNEYSNLQFKVRVLDLRRGFRNRETRVRCFVLTFYRPMVYGFG
jgi:hypothetical protein